MRITRPLKSKYLLFITAYILVLYSDKYGPGSSVGIATDYGLEGPGIESKKIPVGGDIFCTRSDRPWGHPASCTMGTGSFPGVKRPGRGADYPPPSSR
jgi:hypothetical protein